MKPIKTLISFAVAAFAAIPVSAKVEDITADNVDVHVADNFLIVTADFVLDNLDLKSNHQVLITPVVESPATENAQSPTSNVQRKTSNSKELPSVLVSGRNMHISYERGVLRNFDIIKKYDIWKELRRFNGKQQTVEYAVKVPLEPWMKEKGNILSIKYDPCGCGIAGATVVVEVPIEEEVSMPEELLTRDIVKIPEIDIPNVQIHAGRARIQFEVDRTELHVDPYTCKNGQRIDNRAEIQIIDDSVKYALSDPNVELIGIEICGYASPESPYLHNVELADGRSKALAEYLADRYNIPREKATYSSVPENWGEFREMVVNSDRLTERQRSQLLRLIDEPASTPEQWDRKEWLLKTEKPYVDLYRSFILPEWFPKLRATTFALHTQLKDMDDEHLAQVYKTTPGKMSLQQFCRVAKLYPSDSDEFNDVVLTALAKYPTNQTAITNAAIAAIVRGEYDRARKLLDTAEQTPAIFNLRGLMAESERNYEDAIRYYDLAGDTDKVTEMRIKANKQKLKEEKINKLIGE